MTTDKSKQPKLKNDYERMVPEFHKGAQIYGEHVGRYEAALNIVTNKKVLDIACGSGYGSYILSKNAQSVVGVDVSQQSIDYATAYYKRKNITYKKSNGRSIPFGDNEFDVIISFETIEHIDDYNFYMKEIKRCLKDDGLFILSTPNKQEFAEGNHYHLHEFKETELTNLIKKYFKNTEKYYQATWICNIINTEKIMLNDNIDQKIKTQQTAPINPDQFLYFYYLCSNRKISEVVDPLCVLGEHWSEKKSQQKRNLTELHVNNISNQKELIKKEYKTAMMVIKDLRKANKVLKDELESIKSRKYYKFFNRNSHKNN